MVQKRSRMITFLLIVVSLLVVAAAPGSQQFRPLSYNDEWRDPFFVCREDDDNDCYDGLADGDVTNFIPYLEHVLANEWGPWSDTEALKAGSIAIRTFADREICLHSVGSRSDRIG